MYRFVVMFGMGLTALVPLPVFALTLVEVAELFNIFVGLMLTASLLLFVGGVGAYFARLGTWPSNRDGAIKIMEWGVVTLFILIVILALVQFFQEHPMTMSIIVAFAAIVLLAGFVLYVLGAQKKKSEE